MTISSRLPSLLSPPRLSKDLLRTEMLGQRITQLSSEHALESLQQIKGRDVVLGVPDDRGVALNHGFVGASAGPEAFRNAFYRLYDTRLLNQDWAGDRWFDCGDLNLQSTIAETHAALAEVVHGLFLHGAKRVYVIGGGHDFSFGSYAGHARACQGLLPVVNFDAHFDLRPVEQGLINSGTPFRRVIETLETRVAGGRALFEIGIQRERNPHSLWEYAQSRGISIAEYTAGNPAWIFHGLPHAEKCDLTQQTKQWLDQWMNEKGASGEVHLSIDLDVFQAAAALGTSASTSFGVPVELLWPCMEDVLTREMCRVVDVAELCPVRDAQSQTARLAAAIVFRGSLARDTRTLTCS